MPVVLAADTKENTVLSYPIKFGAPLGNASSRFCRGRDGGHAWVVVAMIRAVGGQVVRALACVIVLDGTEPGPGTYKPGLPGRSALRMGKGFEVDTCLDQQPHTLAERTGRTVPAG